MSERVAASKNTPGKKGSKKPVQGSALGGIALRPKLNEMVEKFKDLDPRLQMTMILGAVMVFLNLSSDIARSFRSTEKVQLSHYELSGGTEMWGNPNVSWWERLFCRGVKTSSFCDNKSFRHPTTAYMEKKPVTPQFPSKSIVVERKSISEF